MNEREFVSLVIDIARANRLNCFVVTDGASGVTNNGNPAVKHARDSHIKWERENSIDPAHDWGKERN